MIHNANIKNIRQIVQVDFGENKVLISMEIIGLVRLLNRFCLKSNLMRLDFSTLSIDEVIQSIDPAQAYDWQVEIRQFLENYKQKNCMIDVNEEQGENVFVVSVQKEIILKTVRELNQIIGLKQGDSTYITSSVKTKNGVIALSQGIEAKMDVYFGEPFEAVKIPYTEQVQTEVNWGLNYVYINENQIDDIREILHRIEYVVVESNGISKDSKATLNEIIRNTVYDVFSVKSFPVAIKPLNETNFKVVGDVGIERSDDGFLWIDSPYFKEKVNTQKSIILIDEKSFRWKTSGDYIDDDRLINLDHIEEVLDPHIDNRFIVVNFPDRTTGEEVITLVVERRYMEEFTYPTDGLEDYEIPQQTYFLGEFPVNDDRAAIRAEVKRLLAEN